MKKIEARLSLQSSPKTFKACIIQVKASPRRNNALHQGIDRLIDCISCIIRRVKPRLVVDCLVCGCVCV